MIATLLALKKMGLPMPAGAFCPSPWVRIINVGRFDPFDAILSGEFGNRLSPFWDHRYTIRGPKPLLHVERVFKS